MSGETAHVLALGEYTDVLPWLWRSQVTSSAICTRSSVRGTDPLEQHDTAVVLDDGATFSDRLLTARVLHERRPVDAVVAFDDSEVVAAARIAADLGIPGTNAVDVVRRVQGKGALRAHLTAAGFHQPRFEPVREPAEVLRFGDHHGWPVVVKPTDGSGSQGVSLGVQPHSHESAFMLASAASPSGEVLVEEQLSGVVLTVDTFSSAGTHHVVMIGFELFSTATRHPLVMCTGMPAPIDDAQWDRVAGVVREALTVLGVQVGPTHAEVFLDPETEAVTIVEMQLRLGGEFPEVTAATLGIDTYQLWAEQLRGGDILPRLEGIEATWRRDHRPSAIVYGGADQVGRLRAVTGIGRVDADASIVRNPHSPDETRHLTSYRDHYLAAIASGTTVTGAVRKARCAVEGVTMRISSEPVVLHPDLAGEPPQPSP